MRMNVPPRAVWDEEHSKWWFSATDIVRATHKLKITAEDGKNYTSDILDAEEVNIVAKNIPNNRA